jgi:hypothetical protein
MLCAEEMLAKARECEVAAFGADASAAAYYRLVAHHWREMAAQLKLLEREPIYRIIRDRPKPASVSDVLS